MGNVNNLLKTDKTVTNRDGYKSFNRSIEEQFIQLMMCNSLTNTFYVSSEELLSESVDVIREMMKKDTEFAAKAIVYARNNGFMRSQPILALAILAEYDKDLFKQIFNKVCLIPSDVFEFLSFYKWLGHGTGGRMVKQAIANFLNANLSPYWIIKYNGRGRGFNLKDLVKISHIKPANDSINELIKYLLDLKYDADRFQQLKLYDWFRSTAQYLAEDSIIDLIRKAKLPHEVVTSRVNMTPAIWEALMYEMPVMALLRHLATLEKNDVFNSEENVNFVIERLTNEDLLLRAKILPFRVYDAYKKIFNERIKDALREALETTVANLPDIEGKTAILIDTSWSMEKLISKASLFAISLYKKTNGNAVVIEFNNSAKKVELSKHDSILTQMDKFVARGGTNTASAVELLIKNNIIVDNIVVITDEQQNDGAPFYNVLNKYRKWINPNVKTFIVDLSPYRNYFTPPADKNTFYVFGWSQSVLDYIALNTKDTNSIVDEINNVKLF